MTAHHPTDSFATPVDIFRLFWRYRWRWIASTVVVTAAAVGHALTRPDTWEASQAVVVRNDAAGNIDPGKFRHSDDMKLLQETLLEIARNRGVLAAALKQVGPSADAKEPAAWPTQRDVDNLAEAVSITPPKGAEFGRTEVFYVKVQDHDRQRAVALTDAVCEQLQQRFQLLRNDRAQGMVDELAKAASLAEADVRQATHRLGEVERTVGGDLAELRALQSSGADSDLRRKLLEIDNELRQAEVEQRHQQELLNLLLAAQHDPGQLLATPHRLLDAQPGLRRLKEGLVDAQLRTSQLLGSMTESHPLVKAALHAEREISAHLHQELALATHSLRVELRLADERANDLNRQRDDLRQRLERLAGLRAEYATLVADVEHHSRLLEQARRQLSDARAAQAGVAAASTVARIDAPEVGSKPKGPGRSTIVAGGLAGGLLLGLGLVVLTAQPAPSPQPRVTATTARLSGDRRPQLPADDALFGLSLKKAFSRHAG